MAPTDAELRALFTAFDTSGDGFISFEELMAAMQKGGKRLSADRCKEILEQVDENADGQIGYDEFVKVFELAPDALPAGLDILVDVGGSLLGGLASVGEAGLGLVGAGIDAGAGVVGASVDLVGATANAGMDLANAGLGLLTGRKSEAFDIKDTNVANIGSDEDKAARKAAAETEAAWVGCGKGVGIEIWRVESFNVVKWPKEQYGEFYEGDSYIILHTYKQGTFSTKLLYDLYFWLGSSTSQDEMGTAAYKTVELDDLLDGLPVQHREVMKHESAAFKSLFKAISYLKGGVASSLRHVEAGAYVAKLLQVKKQGKTTSIVEVSCMRKSLNDGDAFVLDTGATIYVWSGANSSPFEKMAANLAAENLESSRNGAAKATGNIDDFFWEKLGGEGPVMSKEEAGEVMPEVPEVGEGVLFKLSDATGELTLNEVGRGDLKRAMLGRDDVYVVDAGPELIVWVGEGASNKERAAAFNTASSYLRTQARPLTTPVSVIKSKQSDQHALFKQIFAN